jgi:hypothetical protein
MRDRSAQLGERIRNEDGLGRAVEVLEQMDSAIRPAPRSNRTGGLGSTA